ncbi:50S ribosomal protein L32 [Fusobacterium necrophorum]|uniref:50S ribosomal protein L32 n=1 Tax=Fusobacterium necrophorum TaxID=859 RepID=UPI0001BC4EC4|nr:50S ribosomal protein L32 [Fusobacterium necrophorum]EFS22416.1 ribosomal protein L32 [Fusobacterium necrophorum D12]MDK4515331.1 50S ribosomal protein L32 [Fusobacterium necrophorum]
MAVPKKKTSKAKKNMRRSHHALAGISLSICSKCGAPKRQHRVCLECGDYNGKQVLVAEAE